MQVIQRPQHKLDLNFQVSSNLQHAEISQALQEGEEAENVPEAEHSQVRLPEAGSPSGLVE